VPVEYSEVGDLGQGVKERIESEHRPSLSHWPTVYLFHEEPYGGIYILLPKARGSGKRFLIGMRTNLYHIDNSCLPRVVFSINVDRT